MILKCITVGPFFMNCYIAGCEETKEAVIIDPGDEIDRILKALDSACLVPKLILNTHGHIDHSGGVQELKERTGLKFMMHKGDLPIVKSLPEQVRYFGLPPVKAPEVDGFLEDGDEIDVGEIKFKVLHTPGHTPGGLCFHHDAKVIVGDALFAGSIGRTDLPGGSFRQLIDSIRSKLLTLDPETEVYCGHGPSTTIGYEMRHNPFLQPGAEFIYA